MNRLIFITLLAFVACSTPKTDEYQISGKIMGKVPAKAYLQIYKDGNFNTLDSATFTNGEFKFQGKVDFPDLYFIQIGGQRNFLPLFVENSNIKVQAHVDSLADATITGSATQDEHNAYKKSKEVFTMQLDSLEQIYRGAQSEEEKEAVLVKYDAIDSLQTEHVKEWIKGHGSSILAPYIIRRELVYYLDLDELESLTNVISPALTNYSYTKELHDRIELLRTLKPGMPAPEFTQNNPNDEPVSLSDFKGKYLMIDFWASWCGPCRRANPTVVSVYNKYKDKGFTILGVSMDKSREKWSQAIEDDGLVWSQVSTLEGWGNPVGKQYGVLSIPHAILIDPDGNIVKRGVRPDELDELIGSLVK